MLTLKEIILVKLVAGYINDSDSKEIINPTQHEICEEFIRKRTSPLDIPLTLQEDIVALIKPILSEVFNFLADHNEIFTEEQEGSLKFCFNADGTVDRVKTADLLIQSEWLDAETRFVLACQYWSSWDVLAFFKKLHESARVRILNKYAIAKYTLCLDCDKNAVLWIRNFKAGRISESQSKGWRNRYNWNEASLQSRLLDDLTERKRQSILYDMFENSCRMHIRRFCLSRMSAGHREALLKRFPLKVLRIYLLWPNQRFFMDAVNKVWDRLPGDHFACLLHIIICQKILELWKDFHYVNLLQQLWHRSPDHLKQYVEGTAFFEILMEILKNGVPCWLHQYDIPERFFLHDDVVDNAPECDWSIDEIERYH